ncbi:MAG: hypothetical protein BAJALOKI3v1_110021 [Promethearchaeota archaeon]|nr:MAG: hypothetical protein BAJALOKI3v1_110021 [Candidatus Lokiarchaeota archaeon]
MKSMTAELYYFSGTGNSLYVTDQISQKIPYSNLIPIPALLNEKSDETKKIKRNHKSFKTSADIVGFIFPCHGITIPVIVRKFLKMLDIASSDFLFAVVTRGGSIFRGFSAINKIIAKQDKQLDATFVINMGMNDPKLKEFSVPTEEEFKEFEENVQKKVELIHRIVNNRGEYHDNISGINFTRYKWINYILERLIPFFMNHYATGMKSYFYVDSKCTSCGICEKMCLANKIKLIDDQPIWQEDMECYLCYGCLNFCPNEAIQIYDKIYMKSYTPERGRYPHPYAKVNDMVNQKSLKELGTDKYVIT